MKRTFRRARTMDVAFTYRMPNGIPGEITRKELATVEPCILDTTNYPTAFGLPGVIDGTSHSFRKIMAGDTTVYGVYARPYPMQEANTTDGLGTATPPVKGIANVLKRGYMTVQVVYGTATKGGAVYVRTVGTSNNETVGTFDAQSDSTNSFLLAGAYFNGTADSNGNVEIAYNL